MLWWWSRTGRVLVLSGVGVAGVVAGVVGWGGFNTVLEATNSTAFCISCHEMRSTVYEEYRRSVHYANASGVRAACADCHVPRDWTHKLLRKVQATNELYHWLVGTIDTPEKFEAKRHELARHEWDRMRATDSRECRNCHSFEAMDFHKQNAKAATTMAAAAKAGKTCIDCHKGIAHNFPDVTAGHRRAFADQRERAKGFVPTPGSTVYPLTSLALLERPEGAGPIGEVSVSTPLRVLTVEGGFARVELTGWHRDGSPETLYRLPGKRIPLAKLTDAGAAGPEALRVVTDPDSGQPWTEARITAWTRTGAFSADRAVLWEHAARIADANCTLCHTLHSADAYTANQWIGTINAMKRLTPLDDEEVRLLQIYLQTGAKDAAASR
ncbi:cytochrome C [Azospirillum sp. RWY-5-1]|uniref:Cytochrome c-type protein n=1 Tax=Azospirillum oleiclasticum TaxID=2735135 RepID=A0ABX2T5H9_9PROT|nr:NapC/NirT family cytochrome c [Azospirillum oleiclasticum]NYZ12415.1 cytochrome C [Azospirillum oleiclasticum]NYZ19575.1 cytochrome C [Azospirillum oleiclasticum]